MHRTLNDIRNEGLDALRKRLGRAGMIRFLQQFESGAGDYVSERKRWAEQVLLEELEQRLPRPSKSKPKRKR